MTYEEAIQTIEQASTRKKLYPFYLRMERLGLLFDSLGIDLHLPSIHIAGTSGKGSTSLLCAEVLQRANYRVGLYTSPHLQTPRERMQISGNMPSQEIFAKLTKKVYEQALEVEEQHSYGAFNAHDLLFTIAMYHFTLAKVDVAVIETFMGGQYDPTNIIKPLVSVVTNVDLDHTRILGKTVESIAMVKAGVIKRETPFITGATQAGVLEIFRKRCQDLQTSCFILGENNTYRARLLGQRGSILSAEVLDNLFANLQIRLLGRHQVTNALLVLYIIQVLRSRGWLIADTAIRTAFAEAFIPGRLEIVQEKPLVILDGAHNPAKAKALAHSLKRIFPHQKVVFVFAMKRGKNLTQTLSYLKLLATKFIVTTLPGEKGISPKVIAANLKALGVPVTTRRDPFSALKLALNQVKKDQLICITGSLYLVGRIRNYWYPEQADQPLKPKLRSKRVQKKIRSHYAR